MTYLMRKMASGVLRGAAPWCNESKRHVPHARAGSGALDTKLRRKVAHDIQHSSTRSAKPYALGPELRESVADSPEKICFHRAEPENHPTECAAANALPKNFF